MPRAAVVAVALVLRCALGTPSNAVEVSSHGSLVEGDKKLMRRVGETVVYDRRSPQPDAVGAASPVADASNSMQVADDASPGNDSKGQEGKDSSRRRKGRKGKGRKGKGRKGKGRKGKGRKGKGRKGKGKGDKGGAKDIDEILGDDQAKEEKKQADKPSPSNADDPPVGPLAHDNAQKVPAPSPAVQLVPPQPSPSPLPPQPEDDNLCKEVKGVKVEDTRDNKKKPEWAGVSLIRHGEKKKCGNAMFLGEFPNGRLAACASAVATNASCSNNFQLHKDTYNCACVTSWDVCEPKEHKATCLYELNPGEFDNATESSGKMEDEQKHGKAKVDRGDDANEADGSDKPAPGHYGKSDADGDDQGNDKDDDEDSNGEKE